MDKLSDKSLAKQAKILRLTIFKRRIDNTPESGVPKMSTQHAYFKFFNSTLFSQQLVVIKKANQHIGERLYVNWQAIGEEKLRHQLNLRNLYSVSAFSFEIEFSNRQIFIR